MKKRPEPPEPDAAEAKPAGDERPAPAAPDAEPAAADPPTDRLAALEDRVKRMQAEFLNETRRIRSQADADRAFAIQRVVVDLLPVADALHGAAATLAADAEAARFREGLELVVRQLDEVLARHGVTRIEAVGKPFDPTQHEAVLLVDRADLPPQTVVAVVRPGFALNGRVVRPAHVTVSRVPAPPAGADEGASAEDGPGA
jgi:molecular chaperone GrpE